MEHQEKTTQLKEAKERFDANLKLIEETFGKDSPMYEVARKEALNLLQQSFSLILKND